MQVKDYLTLNWHGLWKKKWYFVTKIVLTYCEKFEAEGQEFAKILRSLEHTVSQNNFGNKIPYLHFC